MSSAKELKEANYGRAAAFSGRRCRRCAHFGFQLLFGGGRRHFCCANFVVSEFHSCARIQPRMVCDKFKEGGTETARQDGDKKGGRS